MIDWHRLLDDHGIHFVTAGPNTGRDEVSVNCPLCAGEDPSAHLGINLRTGWWNCWRNNAHRGKSPQKIISILLGVSAATADHLAKAYGNAAHDDFDALAAGLSPPEAQKPQQNLKAFDDFEPIKKNHTKKFWDYLCNTEGRGFLNDTEYVICDYSLKACLIGQYRGRLIIPIFGARSSMGERSTFNRETEGSIPSVPTLLGWQARSLRTVEGVPRYLTSSAEIKRIIYNMQNIMKGGDTLYICEGPFDAIKIDFYGKPQIRATCVFGATTTQEQLGLLFKVAAGFRRIVLLFDNDATGIITGFQVSDWLPGVEFGILPHGGKDTDPLSPQQMRRWLHGFR